MKLQGADVKNLMDARRIAGEHNMFVAQKSDCFIVYRRLPHQERGTRLGRATSTPALLRLVERCARTSHEVPA